MGPDIKNFKKSLKERLQDNKTVITDKGYNDEKCITDSNTKEKNAVICSVRARHETVNGILKFFMYCIL